MRARKIRAVLHKFCKSTDSVTSLWRQNVDADNGPQPKSKKRVFEPRLLAIRRTTRLLGTDRKRQV